jgi:hypothetical protein
VATLEELVVRLEADNAKLVSALEESAKVTSRSAKQMEDAISSFSEQSSKQTSKFSGVMQVFAGTVLAQVAVKAAELAAEAFRALIANFGEGVGEAAEFEQQMARLSNSLALNGHFTKEAIDGLSDWIDEMEKLSGVDDAVIAGNLAMLSSMTKLNTEGLKQAQEAAINLSAGLGIDLAQATKLVAKAAEGSTDGFKRWGISIAESADKGQTFSDTLKKIENSFSGAALAKTKTYQGSLDLLKGSWGNLFQAIGDIVVKNPAVIAAMKEITKVISSMTDYVKDNADNWRRGFANAIVTAINILGVFAQAANMALMPLKIILNDISMRVQAVVDTFQAAGAVLSGKGFAAAAEAFKETREKAVALKDSVVDMVNMRGPLDGLVQKIADFGAAVESAGSTATTTNEQNKKDLRELTALELQRLEAARAFADGVLQSSNEVNAAYMLEQDNLEAKHAAELISFETYKKDKLDSLADQQLKEMEILAKSLADKEMLRAAEKQLEAQHANDRLKLQTDLQKKEEEINKRKLQGFSNFFGNLAALQSASSKELFAIGKAAAVAQATIDGYAAIQGAYKQGSIIGGPPLGALFAAAAGVATAANLAKITGASLASGIDSVPGVGTKDNFPAVLAPGERVVPSETNKDLTEFLQSERNRQQPAPVFNLNFYGPVWSDKASAGAEIVDAINEAVSRGMSLRILGTT